MKTMTTINTSFVTLFFALRPSLQHEPILTHPLDSLWLFCYYLEILIETPFQRDISMMMYMKMMMKIGRANEVMKNPM